MTPVTRNHIQRSKSQTLAGKDNSAAQLCRHDYGAGAANSSGNFQRPRLSGGSGAGVEQSASTDQGRLVAAVFSTADKGPSVSAVVQLTSDYYHRLKSDM